MEVGRGGGGAVHASFLTTCAQKISNKQNPKLRLKSSTFITFRNTKMDYSTKLMLKMLATNTVAASE